MAKVLSRKTLGILLLVIAALVFGYILGSVQEEKPRPAVQERNTKFEGGSGTVLAVDREKGEVRVEMRNPNWAGTASKDRVRLASLSKTLSLAPDTRIFVDDIEGLRLVYGINPQEDPTQVDFQERLLTEPPKGTLEDFSEGDEITFISRNEFDFYLAERIEIVELRNITGLYEQVPNEAGQ